MLSYSDIQKKNGILLPKLFWPTVRKNCSSDWGREFLRSLEQFIQTVKGLNNFWYLTECFFLSNELGQLEFKLGKNIGI